MWKSHMKEGDWGGEKRQKREEKERGNKNGRSEEKDGVGHGNSFLSGPTYFSHPSLSSRQVSEEDRHSRLADVFRDEVRKWAQTIAHPKLQGAISPNSSHESHPTSGPSHHEVYTDQPPCSYEVTGSQNSGYHLKTRVFVWISTFQLNHSLQSKSTSGRGSLMFCRS